MDRLVASGVPPAKIAIGGFSMGGGIAIQAALRSKYDLGGAFALSSYLCDDAAIYEALAGEHPALGPRIWMAHGESDNFVRPSWGEATAKRLRGYGIEVAWRSYPGVQHELTREELDELNGWLAPLVLPAPQAQPTTVPVELGAEPPWKEEL